MDTFAIKEYKSHTIFWDCILHRYYYWNNGKKVTSIYIGNLIEKIDKL